VSIRIGIAGCGKHALGRILPIIEADSNLQLAAVWSRSESNQALLRERGITDITSNFERFLATPLDVVYVASPSGLHFEHTAAILAAGHHAWVEKPVATRLEDVRTLVAMAETGQRMLTEAFMFPWHAQAELVRQTLDEGRIGALRAVSLTFCFPHLEPNNFRYDPHLGGGAFLDHACYLVKALDSYLGGHWRVLGGCSDRAGYAVDVAGAAQLRRESDGLIATLNWGFGRSYINEIGFVGERGRMLVESAFTKPASRPCNVILEDGQGKWSTLLVRQEDPYRRMLEAFVAQYGKPADWSGIRQNLLQHAEHLFGLHALLQHY